jgi:hypothetical protein
VGERRLHPPQGLARGDQRLGRRIIGRAPRGTLERCEDPPLEASAPRPVEGEIAHHPARIGRLGGVRHGRRVGGETQQDVLNDVLGERRAAQDVPGAGDIAGPMARQARERPSRSGGAIARETVRRHCIRNAGLLDQHRAQPFAERSHEG